MPALSLLNWQNRRATAPVEAAIAAFRDVRPDVEIEQVVRPLSDFEHQGIASVAERHDLIIFDHPFCGTIASSRCFEPLEGLLPSRLQEEDRYIGPSLSTYKFGGHLWGAPIDGATQHALCRPDLVERLGVPLPRSFNEVLALGHAARAAGLYLGTAIVTPHALLSIMSYMANLGEPLRADDGGISEIPETSFLRAYEAVRQVLELSPPEAASWNSIDLHEAAVNRDDIVYAPLVYGYATYGEADLRRRLGFAPFAGLQQPYEAGTAIGGTALGLSRTSTEKEAAIAFMCFMLEHNVQDRMVAEHHGQPGALAGWLQPDLDVRFNGFFSSIRSTMQSCWTRPRYDGYVTFQRMGGQVIADCLAAGSAAAEARARLLDLADRPTKP